MNIKLPWIPPSPSLEIASGLFVLVVVPVVKVAETMRRPTDVQTITQ